VKTLPYSEANLASCLSNRYTSQTQIESKNQFLYLKEYLGSSGLNAQTILVEEEYVSKDFLHDYASYYAYCFEPYPKICKRIHFFDSLFQETELKTAILTGEESPFWRHYLGCIVVKPIPITVIGFTILKTYAKGIHFDERNFWGTREYTVHLFGIKIKLISLAFQEQDSVLAACATTAIWTMLNKAALDFHTVLKSPSQITKDADSKSPDGSRLFPNKGLNILQICQAIQNSGLESEIRQPDYQIINQHGQVIGAFVSNLSLKKIINAYSPIGIPIILIIRVPTDTIHGWHAITVSGFKQKAPQLIPSKPEISWLADNIEKIYAHDDQWGPFARITLNNVAELETPWTIFHPQRNPTYVANIVVPLYPKIRISYENIESIVLGLDRILTFFLGNQAIADFVWDVKIHYSQTFKKHIQGSNLEDEEKISLISSNMPKYLWVATCHVGGFMILDFTFDATDVNNGMIGEHVICYVNQDFKVKFVDFLRKNRDALEALFNHRATTSYYDFLIDKLS